jgi:thiol-disulfide isomerase/thioredoxin
MKSLKLILLFLISLFPNSVFSQSHCDTSKSFYNYISAANYEDVICLSKKSAKEKILFYSFGIWCTPCRAHLPNAIKLSKEHDLDFYVLLIDKENSYQTNKAINYLRNIDSSIKILVLKDVTYGSNVGKKYKKFLSQITPKKFENIDDMSKYIILNRQGEVLMVTNWKDNRENNWGDDSEMIKKRILPVLK